MNPKYNVKRQDGFTMIEVMVVVVIVAILAAIAVPIYTAYVKRAHASEAKSVMGSISNSADMFYQTSGEWPSDVEQLERKGLLEIKISTKRSWTFELGLPNSISATSTEEMEGGANHIIFYDREIGKFTGYGSDEDNG
ncbi:MAG: prepilin-type N-terminal cleavage/methylation domain-containing protein [Candidatus Marinimicrobia bacterium]|nr:prepilin-type N-terminal cleavage/methylation domain-containing protein [Candidatus Neomarinimicrobiota bacterium]